MPQPIGKDVPKGREQDSRPVGKDVPDWSGICPGLGKCSKREAGAWRMGSWLTRSRKGHITHRVTFTKKASWNAASKIMMELMTSYILLQGLHFHAYIGVGEQERQVGNDYVLDLRLGYPFADAMLSDEVADTLNYAEVFGAVSEIMQKPAKLLETAAGTIARELFRRFPKTESIDLKLVKLNPPMGADCNGAGVELHFCPMR